MIGHAIVPENVPLNVGFTYKYGVDVVSSNLRAIRSAIKTSGSGMLDEHYSIACIDGIIPKYPHTWSNDFTSELSTDLSGLQLSVSDPSYPTWVPEGNALGLTDTFGIESVWPTPSAATITSNKVIPPPIFGTSFLDQPLSPDGEIDFWPSFAPTNYPFVSQGPTATSNDDGAHPQEQNFIRHTIAESHTDTFAPPAASCTRYTPYSPLDRPTKRAEGSTSFHCCQWSGGATSTPCGAIIESTKNAIGQHLQAAHAIRLSANKSAQDEVCLWDRCSKSMRKESIARHVLAVHLKDRDRVRCPWCGSKFARPDSMQRHQRTCSSKGETEGSGKVRNPRLR